MKPSYLLNAHTFILFLYVPYGDYPLTTLYSHHHIFLLIVILTALRSRLNKPIVVRWSLGAILGLATDNVVNLDSFVSQGASKVVIDAINMHMRDIEIVEQGCG